MPYDAQGRWIEENEWEQMMREQAAQRVQAFSQYNDAPPSLYPNQAAPYGSFPYVDPTTQPVWDTSPERLRQEIEPQYRQPWMFNQEPIADTSAISNVPFQNVNAMTVGNQYGTGDKTMQEILDEASISQGLPTRAQILIDMYGDPSTEVSDYPTGPKVDPNIVIGPGSDPFKQNIDMSRWDMLPDPAEVGTYSVMPNMEVDQPLATGLIPAGLEMIDTTSEVGIPSVNMSTGTGPVMGGVDYSQMAQDWGDPTIMSAPAGVDPTGGMIDQDMATVLSNANMDNLYAQTDFVAPVTDQDYIDEGTIPPGDDLDYTRFLDEQYGGPALDASQAGTGFSMGGQGGFTGGSQLYDMGMDPTFANTGGWGGEKTTLSLPEVIGWGSTVIPGGKVVSSAVKGLVKALTKGATKKSTGDVVQLGVTKKGKTILSDEMGPIAVVDSADPVITTAQAAARQINKIGNPFARQMARAKAIEDVKNTGASVVQLAVATAALSPKGAIERKSDDAARAAAAQAEQDRIAQISAQNAAANALAAANARVKTAAANRAKVAAAKAASRKAAAARLAARKSAAKSAASRAAAARAQAASAAQAKAAQANARAVLANAAGRDRGGPSQAEINAAIEVMSGVDTFGGGRITGGGPMSAAEINVAGGMEFGGAGGMAGSGRGSSGRGGPGGRGR